MEFYYRDTDRDVLILSADGGLNSHNAEQFVSELATLVDAGADKLIVDCTKLSHISSFGIGILIRLHKKLAEKGVFRPLGTTYPSMSPVAWSSFTTGVDPSRHCIYDFLTRDPCTYMPVLSSTRWSGLMPAVV